MSIFLFIMLALSTWRFTHLIVEDSIPFAAKPREWIEQRYEGGNLAYLVSCTWCSSVWVAAAHVAAADAFLRVNVPMPVVAAAALSVLAAFGEEVVDWLARYGLGGDQ